MICPICHNPFEQKYPWQKYCSKKCNHRNATQRYDDKNREKLRAWHKKYYLETRDDPILSKKRSEWSKKYHLANKEKCTAWRRTQYYRDWEKEQVKNKHKRIREKLLEKQCCWCGSQLNLELHHITYVLDPPNVMTLCRVCHGILHRRIKN